MVPRAGDRVQPARPQRSPAAVRPVPAEPVRRADDGLLRVAVRAHGERRHQEERERHLRPAHARARTRRSPGWPRASSGSSCPTSSTSSRSTSRWPRAETGGVHARRWSQLAQMFENRRQYPKAADYWRRLKVYRPRRHRGGLPADRLDQIVGNWGQFEAVTSQPAGSGATVEFRFRNGKPVEFGPRDQGPQAAGRREGLPEEQPQPARLGQGQHRQHRLPPGAEEPEEVPRRGGGAVEDGRSSRARTTSTSGSRSPRPCRSRARTC